MENKRVTFKLQEDNQGRSTPSVENSENGTLMPPLGQMARFRKPPPGPLRTRPFTLPIKTVKSRVFNFNRNFHLLDRIPQFIPRRNEKAPNEEKAKTDLQGKSDDDDHRKDETRAAPKKRSTNTKTK